MRNFNNYLDSYHNVMCKNKQRVLLQYYKDGGRERKRVRERERKTERERD